MKKKGLLSFLMILISYLAFTQNSTQNSVLWKIDGNGLEKPSYIFGTYHMLCAEDYQLKDKVNLALEQTKQFVMEVNYSDANTMIEMQNFMMADKKMSERFSEQEKELLTQYLPQYGMDYESVASFSPIMLNSMITMKYFNCSPDQLKMMDMELMTKALTSGKKVVGLETAHQQLEILNILLTNKDILKSLSRFEENKSFTATFVKAYTSENLTHLNELMRSKDQMSEEQTYQLLDKRNIDWLTKMPQLMNDNPTFFAVGAGHLLGANGVLTLLNKKGYRVTPVL